MMLFKTSVHKPEQRFFCALLGGDKVKMDHKTYQLQLIIKGNTNEN